MSSSYIIEPNIINEEGTEEKLLFPISIIYKDNIDLDSYLTNLSKDIKEYTDTKISDLINGAPSTLDTLKEIADAIESSSSTIELLNNAIGNKADKSTVEALTTEVNSKASNADLENLTKAVNKNSTRIESLEGGEVHIDNASEDTAGILKLYTSTGDNEDGTITQKLFTSNLDTINSSLEGFSQAITLLNSGKMDNIVFTEDGLMKYTTKGIVLDTTSYAKASNYGNSFISVNRKSDTTVGEGSIAFGTSGMVAEGSGSVAMGNNSSATALASVAIGYQNTSSGSGAVALGSSTTSSGDYSFSMGLNSKATNGYAIALGHSSISDGTFSLSMGAFTNTKGLGSISIGTGSNTAPTDVTSESDLLTSYNTNKFAMSKGNYSFGHGLDNLILGAYSYGIGNNNIIKNTGSSTSTNYVYALGSNNTVSGVYDLVVGNDNTVSSEYSTILGKSNNVTGNGFIYGKNNTVSGSNTFTFGENLTNSDNGKTVLGAYNNEKQDTLLEIGNGTSESKNNIFEITKTGIIRTGTSGVFSKLSDEYTKSSGTADDGIGASSLAVYNVYSYAVDQLSNKAEKTHTHNISDMTITDDTTGTVYKLGVDNGVIYIKEVEQ